MTKSPYTRTDLSRQERTTPPDSLLHERAVLCARLARLLLASLSALDWQALRFADRSRLARALARLHSDAALAELAASSKGVELNTVPCLPK